MSTTTPNYKRLPLGLLSAFLALFRGRRNSLWEGGDHLLLVLSDGYRETYKRFYYRDIQAITAYRTVRGLVITVVLVIIALFFGLLALGVDTLGGRIFFGGMFVVSTVLVAVNLRLGPTCKCQLRTAVQAEDLVSLGRTRKLRRALDSIGPRIAQVQGSLTPDEVATQMRQVALDAATAAASAAPQSQDLPTGLSDAPAAPTGQA
jgi:hypothetical protein